MEPQHTKAHSFGIIPIYKDYNGYKVLVVLNSKGKHWGFPKGTPENTETPLETALRELQEETGIEKEYIRIQSEPTFVEEYSFEQSGVMYDKTNTYYIAYVDEMTIGKQLDEISEAKWLLLNEAKELLTYKPIKEIANQLDEYLESLQEYNW